MTPLGPKSISPAALLDVVTRTSVRAELWQPISEKNVADWEAAWRPALQEQLSLLNASGVERRLWPQSREWDWRRKHNSLLSEVSAESFAVVANGATQAMMIVDPDFRARIEEQARQHMIYVHYLEVAPWNRSTLTGGRQRYAGAGTLLLGAAITLSREMGFKGRIGLHSLPQSNDFYANACGMRDLGADLKYGSLRYFEVTPELAEAFLSKGGQGGK
jgi:hypothetical protein